MLTRSRCFPLNDDKKAARKRADRVKAENAKNEFHLALKRNFGAVMAEAKFFPGRQWRLDFYLSESRVAVEIEGGVWSGGRHTRGSGFAEDIEKYNAALFIGIRVYRINALDLRDPVKSMSHLARLKGISNFVLTSKK